MELEGWMTVSQVAAAKNVTREAVHRAVKEGRLVGQRIGHVTLVRQESAAEWTPSRGGNRRKPKE